MKEAKGRRKIMCGKKENKGKNGDELHWTVKKVLGIGRKNGLIFIGESVKFVFSDVKILSLANKRENSRFLRN